MISTQIVDAAHGRPAPRIPVEVDLFITGHGWHEVGRGITNFEGRIDSFGIPPAPGVYRMMIDIAAYHPHAFFPSISITFEVRNPEDQHHIPVILSPFGYTVVRT